MYRRVATILLASLITIAGICPVWADNKRAEKSLKGQWNQLKAAPTDLDAELKALSIFKLWDAVGPQPVMRTLKQIIALPQTSRRVREQARHFLALGMIMQGDIKGAEASYAQRGFLNQWLVVGPFDNDGGTGFHTPFPPEQTAALPLDAKKILSGKDRDISFKKAPKQISHLGYIHIEALFEQHIDTCAYAVTTLESKTSGQAVLWLGAGGALRAFWNGRHVFEDPKYRRPYPNRSAVVVKMNQGSNRLLVKVCSEDGIDLGFFARITDSKAKPWPLTPAADQMHALKSPVSKGPASRILPQPLEQLVSRAKNRRNAKALSEAARYLLETRSTDKSSHLARDMARKACTLKPSTSYCLTWAKLALDGNERRLALGHAIKADPNAVPTLLAMARLEMNGVDLQKAMPFVKKALSQVPGDLESKALEIEIHAEQGFLLTAYKDAEELVRKHPDIPLAIELAADLAELSGRAADALRFQKQSLEFRFNDRAKREVLARASLARFDIDQFEHHLHVLEQLAPFDGNGHAFSARLLEGAGKIEKAEHSLRVRLEIAPQHAGAWKDLGLFLTRHNRKKEGVQALKQAAAIRPQDIWLADYLSYLSPTAHFFEPYTKSPEFFLTERGKETGTEQARYLVDQKIVRVFDSGLSSRFQQIVVEIKDRQAARNWRQYAIHYSPASQRIKVLAARVFHKDGSQENAVARDIIPVSEPWYRLYYDVEAEIIQLPPLVPGDIVEFRYLIDDTVHRNVFNDYFGDFIFVEEDAPKNLWRYVLIAPESRRFYFNDLSKTNLSRSQKKEKDLVFETFEAKDVPAIQLEHGMPGRTAAGSYLHLSTYSSWEELGNWYRGLIRHQLIPDARITEKVQELTKGPMSDRQKAMAIYEWVVTATRYVGLEFGIHGYKPYRAPVVVSRGFGDCKDKASLLVTMLHEAEIDAEFVLVRTNDLGTIDTYPASLSVFNHAIVYVPGPDLWLDGTAEHYGPKEFPFGDQDAAALRLSSNGPLFVNTPVMPAQQNSSRTDMDILLDPDGDAQLSVSSSLTGRKAAVIRKQLEAPRTRRERFESSLAGSFPGARLGDLKFTSLNKIAEPVSYRYTAFVPRFAKATPDALEVPADIGLHLTARYGRLSNRKHTLVLGPLNASARNMVIRIPGNHEVIQLPTTAVIESRFGKLIFEVHEEATSVRITRRFELTMHKIEKTDYREFVAFCRKIDDILSGNVIMRRVR